MPSPSAGDVTKKTLCYTTAGDLMEPDTGGVEGGREDLSRALAERRNLEKRRRARTAAVAAVEERGVGTLHIFEVRRYK